MKRILLVLTLLVLSACVLNNDGNTGGNDIIPTSNIYVNKTIKSYDASNALISTSNYTINGMSVTAKAVGSSYASTKLTYDSNGNITEYIWYNADGSLMMRSTSSWQLLL